MSTFQKHLEELPAESKGGRSLPDARRRRQAWRNRWQTWRREVARTLMGSPHEGVRRKAHDSQTAAWKAWKQRSGHGKSRAARRRPARGRLQRCHVVEGMVQLLANGFVLELLSIQFVWRSEVDRKFKQVPRTAGARKAGKETRGRWQREEGWEGRRRQTLVRFPDRGLTITKRASDMAKLRWPPESSRGSCLPAWNAFKWKSWTRGFNLNEPNFF